MILVSSCICLCPIYWSQVLSREWRCSWSSADRRCSNYIWVINNLFAYKGASYIRDLTVHQVRKSALHPVSIIVQCKVEEVVWHHYRKLEFGMLGAITDGITWHYLTNVDLSSVRPEGNFERDPQPSFTKISWKLIYLKFHSNLKSAQSLTVSSASRSHRGCLLHQGILSTPVPFVPWQSGLLFPRYNLTLKIQGQRSRSKVAQSAQHPVDSFP